MSEQYKIVVEAISYFLQEQSAPEKDRYVFAYTITIRNKSQKGAKLMSRQWIITDSNGKIEEIEGDGVVGKQPYLKPDDVFRYTSGAVIETPVGVMEGSYFFVDEDGEHFIAAIPRFTLSIPRTLH